MLSNGINISLGAEYFFRSSVLNGIFGLCHRVSFDQGPVLSTEALGVESSFKQKPPLVALLKFRVFLCRGVSVVGQTFVRRRLQYAPRY